MQFVLVLFFLAIMAALIYWAIRSGRSGAIGARVGRPPRDVVQAAIQTFTARGWTTTSRSGRNVTFTRSQSPGCGIVLVLFLFGIIPGLIYWVAAKRSLVVSVLADNVAGQPGQADVQISWNRNGGGRSPSLDFLNMIAPGAPLRVGASYAPNTLAEQWEEATDGALSGGQLRRMSTSGPAAPPSAPAPYLGAQATTGIASAPDSPASRAFCGRCGARLTAGDDFCGSCGSKVSG
jgi:hypothetical protein